LKAGWAWGCLYLVANATWAWFFRSRMDSWARRALGERLGVKVIWVLATAFPLEVWVWGIAGRRARRRQTLLEPRLALGSVALCLAGAFIPTAALCLFLHQSPLGSSELGPALYLTTPVLILLFVMLHLRWRAPQASGPGGGAGDEIEGEGEREREPGDRRRPPSEPPGRLGTEPES